MPRAAYTLILALASILVALPCSILFGVYLARPGRRARELGLSIFNVSLAAFPVFVIGILLIYLFGVTLGWAPVDSTGIEFGTTSEKIAAFILPTATLAITLLPHISRLTQVSVRETMTTPYARAAVLRGLSRRTITWRHLMPNASGPIINVVALDLIWLVGGVIIVENVFGFPGLGQPAGAVHRRRRPHHGAGGGHPHGAMFICIGVAADLLVLLFNPRLRKG